MKRAIFSGILAVLFTVGLAAQAKPNFAGTWQLDPEKSTMGGGRQGGGRQGGGNAAGVPLTIAVDGQKMSITRTFGENTQTTVYLLDGTPSKNMQPGRQGAEATEVTYVSKWEGNVLVTTITTAQGARTEKRSIEADGSMKVETVVTGPDGTPASRTAVFKRVTT